MRENTPQPIGSILEKVWENIEKKKEQREKLSQILEDIKSVLGQEIGSCVKLDKIYRKKLILLVSTPVYMQELLFKKEGIIEKVNQSAGEEIIKNISFRVG
jgi:hypothetical protein